MRPRFLCVYVKRTDGPQFLADVRAENLRDGLDAWRRIPFQPAVVLSPVESHDEFHMVLSAQR